MRKSFLWIPTVAVLIVSAAVFAPAGTAGDALVANVDEPILVGDTVYPGGRVSVRVVDAFTPSVSLAEVWIGQRCLGILRAARVDESDRSGSTISFERRPGGPLALVGYTNPSHEVHGRFRFDGASDAAVAAARSAPAPAPASFLTVADRLGHVGVGAAPVAVATTDARGGP